MLALSLILAIVPGESAPTSSWAWEVPPECPDRVELARRLQQEQGGRPPSSLGIATRVVRLEGGYHLQGEVSLDGRPQSVSLGHGGDCDGLVEKFVLYLAPLLPDPDPPPEVARPQFGGYLRGAAELDVGALLECRADKCGPGGIPILGGVLGGGWNRGRLRVELAAPLHVAHSLAPGYSVAEGDFGEVRTSWFRTGLQLRACGALERARFELLLCGEVGLQMLFGRPESSAQGFKPTTPFLPWASVRLVPAAVWWMHPRVGLRLDIAPGVYLHPPKYQVYDRIDASGDTRRPLVEVGWFHAVFGLGLDLRLGKRTRPASRSPRAPH